MATTTIRADLLAYRRWFGKPINGLGLVLALVVGSSAAALRSFSAFAIALVVVGTIAVTLSCIAIQIGTSHVIVTDERIEYRRWWWRRSRLDRSAPLVGALASSGAHVGRSARVLVLRGRDGGPRIWLNGAYWADRDLEHLAATAGVPVLDGVLAPRDFERVAPGSMPWRILHPALAGTAIAVAIVAVVTAAAVGWTALS